VSNQIIKVTDISGSEATLDFLENNVKLFSSKAFIGKNGITNVKEIRLPKTLETLDGLSFKECGQLKKLNLVNISK